MEELSNKDGAQLASLVTVRGRDDAVQRCALLDQQPQRALIVGAGFMDSKLAAACRQRGLSMTMVDRGEAPLAGALGATIAQRAAKLHRSNGIDLRSNASVKKVRGDATVRVRQVELERCARLMHNFGPPARPGFIDGLAKGIKEIVHPALDKLKGKTDIDFVANFACPLPVPVICKILGLPVARLGRQIALKAVIERIQDARLVDDPPPDRASPTLRGPSALRIVVKGILQRLGA